MINVKIKKENNRVVEFIIEGHSGYDDIGKDIICSATSMIVINTINSIKKFTDDNVVINDIDDSKGLIQFSLDDKYSEKTEVLIDALVLGLKSIKETYGNRYIDIKEVL